MTCPTCQKDRDLIHALKVEWEVSATHELVVFTMHCNRKVCHECLKKFAKVFVDTDKKPTE